MGPIAPKDPIRKRDSFYIMLEKQISASPAPGGKGVCFIYEDGGRMVSAAQITGNIKDEEELKLLTTADGFKKLVYGIGVSMMNEEGESCDFAFQMYGKTDPYVSGTTIRQRITPDGAEFFIPLSEIDWSDDDDKPGQIRFEFGRSGLLAKVNVRLFLNDGFTAPEPESLDPIDTEGDAYKKMIAGSLLAKDKTGRLAKAISRAKAGEKLNIAFIGGSITQGAGATPINTECYTYKFYKNFCREYSDEEHIGYIKAGIGGTSSELGIVRYDRDVCCNGAVSPDIVVVEFAVNDAGDETQGISYDSLVRKILKSSNAPAVILLFAVFATDYNLEDRLTAVGERYGLPMVSIKSAVTAQFYLEKNAGRVISKSRFFYDVFHPANIGHTIMADSLMNLVKVCEAEDTDGIKAVEPNLEFEPYIGCDKYRGADLSDIKIVDRANIPADSVVLMGGFNDTDTMLQAVERNLDTFTTPQFTDNWMHTGKSGNDEFSIELTCSNIMIVIKDASGPVWGCADVYVDGSFVRTINPLEVGWVHCNSLMVYFSDTPAKHRVSVKMHEGDEDKCFTILGFGIS